MYKTCFTEQRFSSGSFEILSARLSPPFLSGQIPLKNSHFFVDTPLPVSTFIQTFNQLMTNVRYT